MNFPGATFSLSRTGIGAVGTATVVVRRPVTRATSCGPNTCGSPSAQSTRTTPPAEMFDVRDVTATDLGARNHVGPQDGSPGKRHPLAENMEMV